MCIKHKMITNLDALNGKIVIASEPMGVAIPNISEIALSFRSSQGRVTIVLRIGGNYENVDHGYSEAEKV